MNRRKLDQIELGGRVADALISENSPTGVYTISLRLKQATRGYRRRSRSVS
jgi:hypothetical protein